MNKKLGKPLDGAIDRVIYIGELAAEGRLGEYQPWQHTIVDFLLEFNSLAGDTEDSLLQTKGWSDYKTPGVLHGRIIFR